MAAVKSIAIGKKDAIIAKWRYKVQEKEARLQSYLIKQALLRYYKDGTYLEIGRIHFDPDTDVEKYYNSTKGKPPINLWLNDTPELIEWIEILESENLKVTRVFKDVLQRCITIIPKDEEEFIPSYYDIVLNNKNQDYTTPVVTDNNQEIAKESKRVTEEKKEKPLKAQETSFKQASTIAKKSSKKEKSSHVINMLGIGNRR